MNIDKKKAEQLVKEWGKISGKKFADADLEHDEFGKRFIEHGAVCYFNCARQLQHLIETGDLPSHF